MAGVRPNLSRVQTPTHDFFRDCLDWDARDGDYEDERGFFAWVTDVPSTDSTVVARTLLGTADITFTDVEDHVWIGPSYDNTASGRGQKPLALTALRAAGTAGGIRIRVFIP